MWYELSASYYCFIVSNRNQIFDTVKIDSDVLFPVVWCSILILFPYWSLSDFPGELFSCFNGGGVVDPFSASVFHTQQENAMWYFSRWKIDEIRGTKLGWIALYVSLVSSVIISRLIRKMIYAQQDLSIHKFIRTSVTLSSTSPW